MVSAVIGVGTMRLIELYGRKPESDDVDLEEVLKRAQDKYGETDES